MTENERVTINGKEVTLYREVETNLYRFSKDAVDMLLEALEEREQYRAIGTIEEFKALKEKAEPKKAIGKREYNEAHCPCCNEIISDGEFWALNEYVHHCNECGQAIKGVDWE